MTVKTKIVNYQFKKKRFVKRSQYANAWQYHIDLSYFQDDKTWSEFIAILPVEDVKNANGTFVFDTVKIHKE